MTARAARSRRRPTLYFAFRSPYSWLAVRRLQKEVPGLFEAVDCRPYWDPDPLTCAALSHRGGEFHYVQMSRAKHLYLLMDTKRLAERQGLTMAWPVDVDPWWELPHLAWLLARREGRAAEFYDAVVAARWSHGEDICDPDVIRAAARRAGIDPERAIRAPDDAALREEAADCLYQAYLDDVFGVPYVKWGWHRFWGFDRVDAFLDVWRPALCDESRIGGPVATPLERLRDLVPAGVAAAFDTDAPGGCG